MLLDASEPPDAALPNSGLGRQIIATTFISLVTLNTGLATGWLSPMTLKLQSDDSPVGPLTKTQISYLATLPGYIGIFLSFFFGFVSKKFGRKWALVSIGVPSFVSGIIFTFATSVIELFVGRVLAGFTIVGGFNMCAMYVSEIVHSNIRGTLMTFCTFQVNIGVLLSNIFGNNLSYKAYNTFFIVLPIVYTILIFFLPESPHFLVDRSRHSEAHKSLLWLRGGNHEMARQELDTIKPRNDNVVHITFREAFKTKATKFALTVSMLAYLLQTLSGIHAVMNYAGLIFEESGSPLSPENSAILISSLTLASSLISLVLMDKTGRKLLLLLSFFGSSLTLAALSVFLYLKMVGVDVTSYLWVPIWSLGAYVIMHALGISPVPGILMNEISSPDVKPAISSIVSAAVLVTVIVVLQSFPFLDDNIGLYSAFALPAFFNFVGVFFTIFMVIETKGKSLIEIIDEINGVTRQPESRLEEDEPGR
uniref:Facilitated trehalose transporter Tret1 n=1 Tax=Lygus hesperus TaxID=30085 RepID=A0A0A9WAF4_LYGHE